MTKRSAKTRDPEIANYEAFLKAIGFKRSDGSIFGLLSLSPEPLTSEEIGQALELSQGAVSQGLKNLSHWGAIESAYSRERRAQLHTATVDSLTIVATIFQKREKGAIDAFRRANVAARERFVALGVPTDSEQIQRLDSYITTCDFAQIVMDFAIALSRISASPRQYSKLIRALPKALGTLVKGSTALGNLRDGIVANLKEKNPWR